MSRRKQSKPRQIKRSLGDLEEGEDNPPDDISLSGDEGGASEQEDSAECDDSSPACPPLYSEEPRTDDSPGLPDDEEEEKGLTHSGEEEEGEADPQWDGPDELRLIHVGGVSRVIACRDLMPDTVWGPCSGRVQAEERSEGHEGEGLSMTLVSTESWLKKLPVTSSQTAANCTIYSRGEELYCKVTQEVHREDCLLATLSGPKEDRATATETHNAPIKEEEPAYPAALRSEIQLLPQQAGMAAILATAVVNKDIFPCKDCGIWYRSERNLQAHLMYYCASRQKQEPASPPLEKPRESYPNERICPFPHCNKSCPSASSLEIHMRTHSGERPFVCLICLSAFTTKANCERHLKVHTDTLSGVCHGCGFISTTRDILYSHLVTSHMACQPGSRSEVYSPGPGLPPLTLATGVGAAESGVVLKCQVCGFAADSPALLQQHVRTHLEVRVAAERSPAPRRSPASSSSSSSSSSSESPEPACVPPPDSVTPGANGGSATPREGSPPGQPPVAVQIKEEPRSESEDEEERIGSGATRESQGKAAASRTPSPRVPPPAQVKAEPPSPTPGSSPVHLGAGGSGLPGGAVILPQYMFGPETIMPQASEILAKMSEMVHSRLKQGQTPGGPSAFYAAGSPVQKGATCFECDITFNNVNNFYVHKRLYCSSRRQHADTPAAAPQVKDGVEEAAPPAAFSSSPGAEGSHAPASTRADSELQPGGAGADVKPVEVKSEEAALREASCSEGESGSRASEGSQSPGGSGEDPDDDPTATFCQACNIRFSRHDNYMVHKRFYCASRHDPNNQRPHSGKAAFLPQPIRTRKRKKMYEIHMARSQALAGSASAPGPVLSVKQEIGAPARPTPPLGLLSAPSPGPRPEGDGPIDLSKRPRLREPQRAGVPALPLTDYHKCTACSISFNSIENYLAHKAYYCPATPLQQRPLEQLSRLRRSASTSPRPGLPERADPHPERPAAKGVKAESVAMATPLGPLRPACTQSPALPSPPAPGPEAASSHLVAPLKAQAASPGAVPVVCPYCPLSGAVAGDLMEHFRTVHGLVLTLQPGAASPEAPPAGVSPSLSPRDAPPATPPKPGSKPRRDSMNGREVGLNLQPAPLLPDKPPLHTAAKGALVSPLQNGNNRYCRLCNIKFSSLSTFIAHKKYYCSSHSAEHVK
ncbi:hypothetical protein MATL_G00143010 [Megalops atlanticus]|uniref:Zinc finger protein ZFPM1 n=1 Tax=Megalops atlanticus TaxID=7932 RepID=A0A9D3PUM8_MEGAT|nr:hypothetical protein MATL_G00143010 [Megalops atlanticus]